MSANSICSSAVLSTIASANGCSEFFSKLPAIFNNSCSFILVIILVTFGSPSVIVPVLSNTTVFTKCNNSKFSADFINIPFSAPLPVPTIMATGVAKPNAQGHDITKTAIPIVKANSKLCPTKIHIITVSIAMTITAGTNIPLTLSAIFDIGAFELLASSTNFIICESVVLSPTFVAFIFRYPFLLIVPETTLSPTVLSTGILSPVMLDWSTDEFPSIIIPSTGILPPGLITIISPTEISSKSISISFSSLITVAVLGARLINLLIASLVFPFDFVSRYFPTVINVSIVPADSK